jgi:hypothetical protein
MPCPGWRGGPSCGLFPLLQVSLWEVAWISNHDRLPLWRLLAPRTATSPRESWREWLSVEREEKERISYRSWPVAVARLLAPPAVVCCGASSVSPSEFEFSSVKQLLFLGRVEWHAASTIYILCRKPKASRLCLSPLHCCFGSVINEAK